jgi:hypothetical protein
VAVEKNTFFLRSEENLLNARAHTMALACQCPGSLVFHDDAT